jgi:zinc transporter 1/2/3
LESGFKHKRAPILLAVVYTFTTPIGVAIGVGIASTYHGNSVPALLVQGIFDAISAGILIYDALVNLLTVNITHSVWFSKLSTRKKTGVFVALWMGAGIMALLGRWAWR